MSTQSLNASPPSALGQSEGSLANDTSSDIVLTKYSNISSDANPQLVVQIAERQEAQAEITRLDSKLNNLPSNKLWTISAQERHPTGLVHAGYNPNCDYNQDFQILWSDLSFQVDLSSYDKVINGLIKTTQLLNSGLRLAHRDDTRKSESLRQQFGSTTSGKRTIFENLNGFANSGEITAILGPSGAGKTSLLNALCGRTQNYGGRIQVIGAGRKKRMRLCIIPQKDYLIESLTVRENLLYSSKILNADEKFDHEANIVRVVRMLNLTACFNSLASNISGGEYKRVSIAQELLRQPDILVLDEPTSGLDSLNCKNLIRSLAGLIEASQHGQLQPIAIVLTIHQPDVDVFHMFDHIYCMARGGRVIFDGRPRDVLQTVRSQAGLDSICHRLEGDILDYMATSTTNPANLLIEIASETIYGQEPIDRLARLQRKRFDLNKSNSQSSSAHVSQLQMNLVAASGQLGQPGVKQAANKTAECGFLPDSVRDKSTNNLLAEVSLTPNSISSSSLASSSEKSPPSTKSPTKLVRDKRLQVKNDHSGRFWYHTRLLTSRAFVSTLRDPFMTMVSLLFHLSIPFVMWTVYPRLVGNINACPTVLRDMDMVSMVSNRTATRMLDLLEELSVTFESSTMFFITTYAFSMCALTVSSLAFPLNMHILLKEVRNGWYNLSCYVVAKTLANFPFEVIFPTLSLVMIYLMLDMPDSAYNWRLIATALVMTLVTMISQTQGLIFGALCMDSVQTAIFLASASSLPQTLLSGFTARIKRMPLALQHLSWGSQYRYSSDLINMIRFGFGICPCDQSTEQYLRTHRPDFTDVPTNLKPLLAYYLNANSNEDAKSSNNSAELNSTSPASNVTDYATTTIKSIVNETSAMLIGGPQRLPGIEYDLTLSQFERAETLRRMDSGEIDLFASMADMTARSLSYGQSIEDCSSVRSELLIVAGTPPDSYLPLMFGSMFGLLIVCKILLYLVVRAKVGSRV